MLTHTGDKQHVMRFGQVSYIKQHMFIHTREKQHACPECGYR